MRECDFTNREVPIRKNGPIEALKSGWTSGHRLTVYSDDLRSNPAEDNSYIVKMLEKGRSGK